MNNNRDRRLEIPDWLLENENYIPQADKDTFVNKSILSLLKIIARIKTQETEQIKILNIHATLKVVFTFLLLILLSLSRSFMFIIVIAVYLLILLSILKADTIVKILKVSLGMTLFTFIIMLPAVFWGNGFSCLMITTKVFTTITAVGILSHTTKWNLIISALKSFWIPDIFILVLDITMKYIVMLGDFTLNMLYSLKLRSVGKNKSKYRSLSGIAGTMFIKSKEMAEDMYYAMECRGFSGEYHIEQRFKLKAADYIYCLINLGILLVFIYFERI